MSQNNVIEDALNHLKQQQAEHFKRIEDEQKKGNSWHLSKSIPLSIIIALMGVAFGGYARFVSMDEAIADLQDKESSKITKQDLEHVQKEITLKFDKRDLQIQALQDDVFEVKRGIADIKNLLLRQVK